MSSRDVCKMFTMVECIRLFLADKLDEDFMLGIMHMRDATPTAIMQMAGNVVAAHGKLPCLLAPLPDRVLNRFCCKPISFCACVFTLRFHDHADCKKDSGEQHKAFSHSSYFVIVAPSTFKLWVVQDPHTYPPAKGKFI